MARSEQESTFYAKNDPQWPTLSLAAMREAMSKLSFGEDDSAVNGDAFGTDADILMLADRVFEDDKFHNLAKVSLLRVHRIAEEMIGEQKIGWRVRVRQSLADGFALVPEYARNYPSERWVLHAALAGGLYVESLTGDNLAPFIRSLGKAGKLGPTEYGKQQQESARADQWAANERARLVQSITQRKDSFQIYGRVPGESTYLRTYPASSLDDPALTLEKLGELDAAAADVRRKRGMDRNEQRADLQQRSDEARGTKIFREGDRTELDITVGLKDSGNGYQVVGEGPHSRPSVGQVDRSVPTGSADRSVFVSPHTNEYYTKKEICHIANHNPELFRRLSKTDARFLNQLLAQAN